MISYHLIISWKSKSSPKICQAIAWNFNCECEINVINPMSPINLIYSNSIAIWCKNFGSGFRYKSCSRCNISSCFCGYLCRRRRCWLYWSGWLCYWRLSLQCWLLGCGYGGRSGGCCTSCCYWCKFNLRKWTITRSVILNNYNF